MPQPFVCSRAISYRLPVQPLPEINLDAYKVCLPPRWRPGVLTFAGISVTFGTPLPSGFHLGSSNVLHIPYRPSTLWHRRSSHILNRFGHSQRIKDEYTSGHSEHLRCHSTGRDDILSVDICLSTGTLFILVFCPGR